MPSISDHEPRGLASEADRLPSARQHYEVDDLRRWDAAIREQAAAEGLDWFPQEFELCNHLHMLGFMAYSGMPAHYPHWSFGKAYERQKTLYDHGASGLPYEMVINTNPAIAYLMTGNSLCLQILTMAHVYAHNDFFKNNFTFRYSKPEMRLQKVKLDADRIRGYIEDPSIGLDAVERTLDAAHALSLQCRRNLAIRKLSPEEQRKRTLEERQEIHDPFPLLHPKPERDPIDATRIPFEPEEDILLMIRDYNNDLEEWQRDVLTIVHDEAQYFIPQIETKIMNEGWATFWHHRILNKLALPSDLHLEFLVRHNQVVCPHKGRINPYHVGFKMWHTILDHYTEEAGPQEAMKKLMTIRESDRDVSFLRRFLTPELMRDMDLFMARKKADDVIVEAVADDEHWRDIKDALLRQTGMGSVPVIKVIDVDYRGNRTLLLRHDHDGRDLKLDFAEQTLKHLHTLWGRDVMLETVEDGRDRILSYGSQGYGVDQRA